MAHFFLQVRDEPSELKRLNFIIFMSSFVTLWSSRYTFLNSLKSKHQLKQYFFKFKSFVFYFWMFSLLALGTFFIKDIPILCGLNLKKFFLQITQMITLFCCTHNITSDIPILWIIFMETNIFEIRLISFQIILIRRKSAICTRYR